MRTEMIERWKRSIKGEKTGAQGRAGFTHLSLSLSLSLGRIMSELLNTADQASIYVFL